MFAALAIALLAPPQLAIVARVYEPGVARSYPRAYTLNADGTGLRVVSLPGQEVRYVKWSDGELVYWVHGQAWAVRASRVGPVGLDWEEDRLPNLNMNDTRMTSGDIIKWGEKGNEDFVDVFGQRHKMGIISSVRVGAEGWRLYFLERTAMVESTLWCADARTKTFRPLLSAQDGLLDWHPDRSFVAFTPLRTNVPFDGQRAWANELWVGSLGGASRKLKLPTMELWDLEVRMPASTTIHTRNNPRSSGT